VIFHNNPEPEPGTMTGKAGAGQSQINPQHCFPQPLNPAPRHLPPSR